MWEPGASLLTDYERGEIIRAYVISIEDPRIICWKHLGKVTRAEVVYCCPKWLISNEAIKSEQSRFRFNFFLDELDHTLLLE